LQSYRSPADESFPSAFLQAKVSAASMKELVGQVVSARLFVQPAAGGPTWYSVDGSPVEVKIAAVDEQTLTGEVLSGTVQNTAGAETGVTGTFLGVFQ
jgi:hypothetical protein